MSLLDRFNKVKEPDVSNGQPQWDVDDEAEHVINLPAPKPEQSSHRRDVDGEKVVRTILDLGTRKGVKLLRTKDSNTVEFRWLDDRRIAHRYIVTFADVKLLRMQF